MAYLAFYRTFRPTTFESVVRQEHIVKILKNQINDNKVGHAYLFCGPRGTGKTTLAKIFARAINCENPQNGSPCGVCPVCKSLAKSSNLDISEIDAASNNGVDEMRDLREKVQYPPVSGRYKVYIIDEVHMLTQSAFNAVLKTLEEPPRHAVFILATTEPQKIPATILSRCMRFDFKLIPQADLEGLIKHVFDKTGKDYEEEAVSAIARAGAGSARDCLSIADMCASYSQGKLTYNDVNAVLGSADFSTIAHIAQSMLAQDCAESLAATENILATGKGVGVLAKDLLNFLNNCAIVKMCRNAKEILNLPADRFDKLKQAADAADGHKILRTTEILAKAESDMRYALNGRLTLETAIIKCSLPETDYNIDALIGRIAALERKLEEGVPVGLSARKESVTSPLPAQDFSKVQSPNKYLANNMNINDLEDDGLGNPFSGEEVSLPFGKMRSDKPAEDNAVKPKQVEVNQTPFGVGAQHKEGKSVDVQPTLWEQPEILNAPQARPTSLTEEDKKTVFGKFLRAFRTTRKNAVLFTLCMDLESGFEGDKFILFTPTEAVYKALTRQENAQFIAETLSPLGVFSHEVRLKSAGEDKYEKALNQLRENFKGTDIEIK